MQEKKIIVVDDNEAVLKTLRLILAREFRTVVCVSNPTLLPALLREDDVDLVLLDMNFGTGKQTGGEGLFWLDRIREKENPPAVVLITAFGDVELAVASLKKGATDFIVKPWDNDKLIAALTLAIEKKEQNDVLPEGNEDRSQAGVGNSDASPLTLGEMEEQFIREVLKEKNGNLTLTAQQLNISRQTLYNKLRKYGL